MEGSLALFHYFHVLFLERPSVQERYYLVLCLWQHELNLVRIFLLIVCFPDCHVLVLIQHEMGRKYGVRVSIRMLLLIFEVFLSLLEQSIHVIWIVFTYN